VRAGYHAIKGLSEGEFGLWDQFASVLDLAESDVYLAPRHAGGGAVIGYLDNAQNPKLAQAMVSVLLAGNPKNEMTIDMRLLPEAGFPDHSFTFGGRGSALDAGSAIQAAAEGRALGERRSPVLARVPTRHAVGVRHVSSR